MKVFEILRNDVKQVNEAQVLERMKNFDWKYEFSDNVSRITWGNRELEIIENMVYQLWKKAPDRAVQIWNDNSGEGLQGNTITPSFILRLQSQELN